LTAEGTTSKGTGSISCEAEFCIFYRLGLRTLRTKDLVTCIKSLMKNYTDANLRMLDIGIHICGILF
jgi:hypothetical protein